MSRHIVFGMNSMFAVEQFLPEVLQAMSRRGLRSIVLAPEDRNRPAAKEWQDVEIRYVGLRREISPFRDLRSLWQTWRQLISIRPAVSNMSTPKMGLIGGLAALLAGVRWRIYTLRGLRYETTRSGNRQLLMLCERVACACASRVVCISRSVLDTVIRDRIAPAHKLVLLGERVSEGITIGRAPALSGSDIRKMAGIPPGVAVVGFVGRVTRDKGVEELVRCVRLLRESGRIIWLLVLGELESGDPIEPETAAWLRADPQVYWPGYVADPSPFFAAMDVFVFPTHREGLGRVLLEAAAAGKPVVSTRTTGVIDVVLDGLTGFLVPVGDVVALSDATARILDDPELGARMGKSAQSFVQEQFDNSIYLERLGNMLQSMALGSPRNSWEDAKGLRGCSRF